jgi:toxin ParE1/3/4
VPKKRVSARASLAPAAIRDVREIRRWSEEKFGKAAARRYEALLIQALRDIEADPERHGSKERPDVMIRGARIYHLAFSRDRVPGQKVQTPRHFLVYRCRDNGIFEVARILHDARDLTRHLPGAYRVK